MSFSHLAELLSSQAIKQEKGKNLRTTGSGISWGLGGTQCLLRLFDIHCGKSILNKNLTQTRLKLSTSPSICPWDLLLPSIFYCWIKYMEVSFQISSWLMSWPRLILLTQLKITTGSTAETFLSTQIDVLLPSSLKSEKSQSYLKSHSHTRQRVRHVCGHFLCTLKLKQNLVLHGPASEGEKNGFLSIP